MWRILFFFVLITLAALGFSWLADNPGTVEIVWQGRAIQFSVMVMIIGFMTAVAAIMIAWWLVKSLLFAPGRISRSMASKKREKGLDAVSRGLVAINAGDAALARKLAHKAGAKLQSDGLTTLLKAQAAQLSGDRNTARRLYEAMLENPETEVAGLRGLYLEARREKEMEAARQFAQKAQDRNPRLGWASQALLEIQSRSGQWADALKTLEILRKYKKTDKYTHTRQRAVLLTAMALENEEGDMDNALDQALEAHRLAPDLVPAANVAGRILAAQGNVRKASKIIMTTWSMSPHPDLALTYAHARPGDSPRDRLARIKQLAQSNPHSVEGPIAVAMAAIESHDWEDARDALRDLIKDRPSQRVCELMARIEGGEFGDKGRVREWLARNTRAPRDPVWVADGYISEHWAPLSPITGQLDAFKWTTPTEQFGTGREELPFDEFIPLQAEEKAEDIAEENPARAIVPASALATGGIAAAKSTEEGAAKKEEETALAGDDPDKMSDATDGEVHAGRDESGKNGARDIEDAEIMDEKPASPAPSTQAKSKAKDGNEEARAATKGRKRPEIYIPPPRPDDPGPLGPKSPSRDQKLPQRFRQSRS